MDTTSKSRFGMNRKLSQQCSLSIIINTMVVGVFYFIYNFLFFDNPSTCSIQLLLVFIIIAIIVSYLTKKIYNKLGTRYYKVTEESLLFFNGKEVKKYPWKDFNEAKYEVGCFSKTIPIYFVLSDSQLRLSQYTEEQADLTKLILNHIKDHAVIESEVCILIDYKL